MRKFLCQNINIVTREENSKVAFESHHGKNPNRTAEKKSNKQTKNNETKAQQKRSPIFRKLRVTSAFPLERKENILAMHTTPFRAEWQCHTSLHVPKELSGFVFTLLTGSTDSSKRARMLSESRTVDKVVFAKPLEYLEWPEVGFNKNPPIKKFFPSALLKL